MPARRGRWARVVRSCALNHPLGKALRVGTRVPVRALRRLPKGTWQVRAHGRWLPLEQPRIYRGPCWLHIAGDLADLTGEGGARAVRIEATVWQHRVPAQHWRRLGVAAGDRAQ